MSGNTSNRNPETVLKELLEGNAEYCKAHGNRYEAVKAGQAPSVTVLGCGDSRVPTSIFGKDTMNEHFIVRNIGNQFRNAEGSVKYSLIHLKTPVMVVLGHTGCGALNAAISDYRGEDDAIQKEVVGLTNPVKMAHEFLSKHPEFEGIRKQTVYSEKNVDYQVRKIMNDFALKPLIDSGRLAVVGMVFDIHDVYGDGCAKTHIVNINGVTDTGKLKAHPLVKGLASADVNAIVKRLTN